MVKYKAVFSKQAEKDKRLVKQSGYEQKAKDILSKLQEDPFYPPVDILQGNLKGFFSKRINIQHRIVYEVVEAEKTIRILSMWTHYDGLR